MPVSARGLNADQTGMKTIMSLFRILTAVFLLAPLLAQARTADEQRYLDTVGQLRENRSELAKLNAGILSITDDIQTIRRSKPPVDGKASCDSCGDIATAFCNKTQSDENLNPCRKGACKVPLQPTRNVCYRIYKNKSCYNAALTAAARKAVDDCYLVREVREIEELDEHLSELRDTKKDTEAERTSLNRELDELAKKVDVYSLLHDCAECHISAVEYDRSSRKVEDEHSVPVRRWPPGDEEGKTPISD